MDKLKDQLDFTNMTAEDLAEAINAVYAGYEYMTRNMNNEERKGFDEDLKGIIKNKKIF